MKITASTTCPPDCKQFVIFCKEDQPITIPDDSLNQAAQDVIKAELFAGKESEIIPLLQGDKVAILVGLGKEADSITLRKLATLTKTALKCKPLSSQKPIVIQLEKDHPEAVRAVVDGAKLGLYRWDKYLSNDSENTHQNRYDEYDITLLTEHQNLVDLVSQIAEGVNSARNLANENADFADSQYLEQTIRHLAEADPRCTIKILNQTELKEKGLNLILAVNQGSQKEPKLIIVTYKGASKEAPFTALIGKGITFDTGGLNIKPTGSMETMRMDMSGAAAVIGTLQNTLQLNLPCNLYFVCAIAENVVGPASYKPGDIITGYNGKSVEIGNTDAEGRLVLADANSYLAKKYHPATIINIATLTGAVVVSLGYEYTGLMSTDRALADQLKQAADQTDDRAWELPIYPELKDHVKSKVADIKNIGETRCAGTLSAAEFLRQFAQSETENISWAHLDIAGTSKPGKEIGYFENGATGAGVRLLTQFLLQQST